MTHTRNFGFTLRCVNFPKTLVLFDAFAFPVRNSRGGYLFLAPTSLPRASFAPRYRDPKDGACPGGSHSATRFAGKYSSQFASVCSIQMPPQFHPRCLVLTWSTPDIAVLLTNLTYQGGALVANCMVYKTELTKWRKILAVRLLPETPGIKTVS